MVMTEQLTALARFVMASVMLILPGLASGDLEVHDQDGVSYVSGGVGSDERRMLQAMSGQFNLKLTMTMNDGHFVSDIRVRIQNSDGRTLVDTVADGPILFAQLAPDTYNVSCTLDSTTLNQTANVGGRGQQQLTFAFAAE